MNGEMNSKMIGRKGECQKLENCMKDGTAQLVIVTGRRRVGKTFLIDRFFQRKYAFRITGIQNSTVEESLEVFARQLKRFSGEPCPVPKDWNDAFWSLADYLDTRSEDEKLVVFFDEMPWLAKSSPEFLRAFETFWGNWAEQHDNLVFIACGSVTSWMVEKVFHNRGGLFQRCTCRLDVRPLRLYEVEELMVSKGISWPRQEIARGYMVLGGIPQYWKYLDKSMSLSQNIDELFFTVNGQLRNEILELYGVLCTGCDDCLRVVERLSQRRGGMTRDEIAKKVELTGSDGLDKILNDLKLSGFVREAIVFGRGVGEPMYQLADFYTAFYFHFIHGRFFTRNFWSRTIHFPEREAWEGLTFEQLCLDHEELIEKALGINALAYPSTWSTKGDARRGIRGAQVDLVLDREDNVINLCEIKFWNDAHSITKGIEDTLKRKMESFGAMTGTKKALQMTIITPHGVKTGANSIIANQVTLDDLFSR